MKNKKKALIIMLLMAAISSALTYLCYSSLDTDFEVEKVEIEPGNNVVVENVTNIVVGGHNFFNANYDYTYRVAVDTNKKVVFDSESYAMYDYNEYITHQTLVPLFNTDGTHQKIGDVYKYPEILITYEVSS